MGGLGMYLVFVIPAFVLGLAVQGWLKKTVGEQMGAEVASGLTGAQVAREILDRNGLHGVPVERADGGPLSDHYDPRKKALYLSAPVYDGHSVASTAIAAHEVGHAIQHAKAYKPLEVRTAIAPAVGFASSTWTLILVAGLVLNAIGLIQIAVVVFAAVVLFQLVTLPVEFDASRRAMAQIDGLGLVSAGEQHGARRVLRAAAMTYVAGALAALSMLAYYLLAFFGGRR